MVSKVEEYSNQLIGQNGKRIARMMLIQIKIHPVFLSNVDGSKKRLLGSLTKGIVFCSKSKN